MKANELMIGDRPIPLTVEILEQNGFEVQEQGGGRQDVWNGFGKDNENDIEVEFKEGVPFHVKIDGCGCYFTSCNIRYVHELKQALRLCGFDKDIIIKKENKYDTLHND